ncbi:unnamed protein product [Callosobruchus maculatus]|uniref:Uncharacterized protein n=1 Tax=Callosobruchus maculatus TaxID=64391 RepID=A0A653BT85_CALMS|nr:unnamed protein product [Callosobruchus maculatus]
MLCDVPCCQITKYVTRLTRGALNFSPLWFESVQTLFVYETLNSHATKNLGIHEAGNPPKYTACSIIFQQLLCCEFDTSSVV